MTFFLMLLEIHDSVGLNYHHVSSLMWGHSLYTHTHTHSEQVDGTT